MIFKFLRPDTGRDNIIIHIFGGKSICPRKNSVFLKECTKECTFMYRNMNIFRFISVSPLHKRDHRICGSPFGIR